MSVKKMRVHLALFVVLGKMSLILVYLNINYIKTVFFYSDFGEKFIRTGLL